MTGAGRVAELSVADVVVQKIVASMAKQRRMTVPFWLGAVSGVSCGTVLVRLSEGCSGCKRKRVQVFAGGGQSGVVSVRELAGICLWLRFISPSTLSEKHGNFYAQIVPSYGTTAVLCRVFCGAHEGVAVSFEYEGDVFSEAESDARLAGGSECVLCDGAGGAGGRAPASEFYFYSDG